MKLVCVNGSPHGAAGGTGRIAAWLMDACHAQGVEIETFHLCDLDIRRCLGCGRCMNAGTCAIADDVPRIHAGWGRSWWPARASGGTSP